MKKYQFLNSVILVTLLSTPSHANSEDGFYVGFDSTVANLGDESIKITNKDKSTKNYKEIDYDHCNIKVGYQHFQGNRIEFYYRHNNLNAKEGDITTKTYGFNYEWAFSSLGSDTIVPYILIGIGGGKVSSSKIKSIDKAEAGEANLGIGIHYKFNKNIDMQMGYSLTSTGFDKFDNKTTDDTSVIDQNQLLLGLSYKF